MDDLLVSAEFWSAVVGALMGGGFTLAGSLASHRWQNAATARRQKDQLRREAYLEFLSWLHPPATATVVDSHASLVDPGVSGARVVAFGSEDIRRTAMVGQWLLASARRRDRPMSSLDRVYLESLWKVVGENVADELGPEPIHPADQDVVRLHREQLDGCRRDALRRLSEHRAEERRGRRRSVGSDAPPAPSAPSPG